MITKVPFARLGGLFVFMMVFLITGAISGGHAAPIPQSAGTDTATFENMEFEAFTVAATMRNGPQNLVIFLQAPFDIAEPERIGAIEHGHLIDLGEHVTVIVPHWSLKGHIAVGVSGLPEDPGWHSNFIVIGFFQDPGVRSVLR